MEKGKRKEAKRGRGENLEFHTILINAADTLNAFFVQISNAVSVVLYFRNFLNSNFLKRAEYLKFLLIFLT